MWVGRRTLLELRRHLEDFRPPAATIDELFVDQDGGPLSTNAIQCVLNRLKRKLGLEKLSAHQLRRTWATNYRKHGVGDLYDLQLEGGREDLSVPQRFYVRGDGPKEGRASVMDRWELARRKDARGRPERPIQAVGPVQGVQVGGRRKTCRPRQLNRAQ